VLAGYYAAAMEVDDELEVVVLPPFDRAQGYNPRTDLRDIAALLTLAPSTSPPSPPPSSSASSSSEMRTLT
jgi:hypothetical protein